VGGGAEVPVAEDAGERRRLRDVLPQSPLFQFFDSAVVYEGETAFLQLVEAVGAKRDLVDEPFAEEWRQLGVVANDKHVRALQGRRAGETVKVSVPAGTMEMKILAVS
jgi:hypothetical protein